MHREDAFCFESALAVDVHTNGRGGNNLWRNIEEELPVIFYLWAGAVMTLDGARRLLLNVNGQGRGALWVELQDRHGRVLPGFSLSDGLPIAGINAVNATATLQPRKVQCPGTTCQ